MSLDYLFDNIDRNTTDVLVIADKDLTFTDNETKPDHIHYIDPFDYKYTAKYLINDFKKVKKYDNFLYMDADCMAINKGVQKAFIAASNRKNILHSVKEKDSIDIAVGSHKFSNFKYPNHVIGYNAGTFSFNKALLPLFKEFLLFIEENKDKAIHDQSLFNEFFIRYGVIEPTLSLITYMTIRSWRVENMISREEASIIHFFGGTYEGKPTDSIEYFLRNKLNVIRLTR